MSNALPAPDRPCPGPCSPCPGATLYCADCRDVLPTLPSSTYDLVFSDPPYPEISRSYGRWAEVEWWEMMRAVVPECMRVLKPTGSAVFVLQPNSERVGRMRTWHLKFQLWVAKRWGLVQDAYWWNNSAMPEAHAIQGGLMRPSVKACVWVGPPDCYRDQAAVLIPPNLRMKDRTALQDRKTDRLSYPSGQQKDGARILKASRLRGGVTPFNWVAAGNGSPPELRGRAGHPAGTPLRLCDFWVRYLCPPGGAVLDPFSGTATTGLAALKHGCDYTGVERIPEHHATARRRLAEAAGPLFATPPAADAGG